MAVVQNERLALSLAMSRCRLGGRGSDFAQELKPFSCLIRTTTMILGTVGEMGENLKNALVFGSASPRLLLP